MSERLVHLIRRAAPSDGVADADLLRRWAAGRDEAAFELLLRRHAGPVWRTCRAVAGADADDAFQATFLALARRAGAVRGNLPGWLHAVARHASLRARRAAAVGSAVRTVGASTGPHSGPYEDEAAILHAELARLPDRYRLPLVLCHLHGRTQAEAATELGLPLGTVATRVRRGCDRLRVALTRRGLAPVVAFGPPLLPPADLTAATLGVGLGATVPPPTVHTLATGAVSAMSRTKLKLFVAVAVALVGAAVGGGAIVARQPAADPPAAPPAVGGAGRTSDYFDRRDAMNHLKKVLLAVHTFHDARDNKLPADILGPGGRPLLSWRVALLPYLDEGYLFEQFKLDEPWDSPANKPLGRYVPAVYRSAGAGPGLTRVKMLRGPDATLDPAGNRTFADFRDGSSNTVGVVDTGAAVEWTKPGDLDYARDKPLPDLTSPFTDGYPAGFLDGSVRWLRPGLAEKTLRTLIDRDDATVASDDIGPPPGKRPLTDREKRQAAQWLRQLELARGRAEIAAAERAAVAAAVAKHGPVGLPPVPAADDLSAIERQLNAMHQLDAADSAVAARLIEALKEKDPKAANALRAEFCKKYQALYDRWRQQQKK